MNIEYKIMKLIKVLRRVSLDLSPILGLDLLPLGQVVSFRLRLNCKCRTHNSEALIIINQTIHSKIGYGSQVPDKRPKGQAGRKEKAGRWKPRRKQNKIMNGTSEMPKWNSSNELPPQNAGGKKKQNLYIYEIERGSGGKWLAGKKAENNIINQQASSRSDNKSNH